MLFLPICPRWPQTKHSLKFLCDKILWKFHKIESYWTIIRKKYKYWAVGTLQSDKLFQMLTLENTFLRFTNVKNVMKRSKILTRVRSYNSLTEWGYCCQTHIKPSDSSNIICNNAVNPLSGIHSAYTPYINKVTCHFS